MREYPVYEGTPSESGWYATTHCWNPVEGIFPSAHWWDGSCWKDDPEDEMPAAEPSIHYYATKFSSEEEALKCAEEHDPDRAP